jgi:hypothetical protein
VTKEEKLTFLKQSFSILEKLGKEIQQNIAYAEEGIRENNANLIIGGLVNINQATEHIKNIYETMLFIHRH